MLKLIFAPKGAGKTTELAKQAYRSRKKYKYIFCTDPIANTLLIDVDDIGRVNIPRNSLLLIDEGAIRFTNNKTLKPYQSQFFILQRHYEIDIIIISQSWEDINIKLRRLYTHMEYARKGIFFGLLFRRKITTFARISKTLVLDEEQHVFVDGYFKTFPIPFLTRRYTYRPRWYKYFNSWDAPEMESNVRLRDWNVVVDKHRLIILYNKINLLISRRREKIRLKQMQEMYEELFK